MSAGYDGNIKLGVSVTADSKSVVAELGALRKQIVDMFSSVDKSLAGGSGSFSSLEKSLSKIATDVGDITKVLKGLPTKDVAKVVDTVKEVGTAASKSGDAVKSAFDFDVETASTEELYQKLKQLRAEAEAIRQQKLADGFSPAQAENSKDVRVRKNKISDIATELRNNRGLSDVTDYQPAMNFSGDVGDEQVKNLENALVHAYEALQDLQYGLADMSEADDGFVEKTARVNELTAAIANLNEQLGFEQVRLSGVNVSASGDAPKTAPVSASNIGYDASGIKYAEVYGAQGREAAEEFIRQYNEILNIEGKEAAVKFAKSFNVGGAPGENMISQYKKELASLQSRMKDFDKLKIVMSDEDVGKTLLRIDELKNKIAELIRDARDMNLDVPMDDSLRDAMRQVEELQSKMKQFGKDGTGFSSFEEAQSASARLAGLTQSVNEYFRSLDPAQQKLAEFKQAMADVATFKAKPRGSMTADDAAQYESARATLKGYKNDLASLIQIRNALKSNIGQFEKTGIGMNSAELKQSKVLLADVSHQCDILTGSATRAGDAMKTIGVVDSKMSQISTSIAGALKGISKLTGFFGILGKRGSKASNSIGKGFKRNLLTLMKFTFGVRGLFTLFRRLRSTAVDSLKTIASQFPSVNKQFSETITLLSGLKGSFGTLALPLITAVLPAVNAVIQALTSAIQLVAKFFATLSGGGVIYKVTAKQQDFADSLNSAGGAAKEAAKSLMGFDELNVLQDDTSGGGGGGSDWTYEEEMVDPKSAVAKFAAMLKEAWATGDFLDVGKFLAEQLEDGLNSLDSWITGDGFALAEKIGGSLATLINGITSVSGLAESAGRTIADAFNMITTGLNEFLSGTDWEGIGEFIGTSITSLFDNVDWNLLGQTISNAITGLLETIISALKTTDWEKIGQSIGELIAGIDFSTIVWDVTKLVAGFVSALAEGIAGWAETEPISAAIATMLGGAFVGVKIAPIITTVIGWFGQLGEVFTLVSSGSATFSEAMQLVFGPGSVLGGIGMVIGGAITAISSFLSMLINGFDWLKEILMVIGVAIAAVGAIILGAPALVTGIIAAIVAAVMSLVVVVKDNWNAICDWFSKTWNNLKTGWSDFWDEVGQIATNIWTSIQTSLSNIVTNIKNTFVNGWNTMKTNVTTIFNNIKTSVVNVVNGMKTSISTALTNIKNTFVNVWTNIKNSVSNIVKGLSTVINGVISGIKNGVSGVATSVKNAINKVIRSLNGLNFTVPSWVPVLGGKKFKFNIPYLAQGAVIPPNKEFMAVLGDQKHGTNIEAPLDTIKQAVAEELSEQIDAMMVGFQAVVDAINNKDLDVRIGDKEIGRAADRYNKRQALVRGTL